MPYDVVAYEADDFAMQLNEAEEGLFHRMLRRSWMNGSIPADMISLASVCRTHPSRLKKAWLRIAPLWKPHPSLQGRLINLKQERERAYKDTKTELARASAVERWNKKKTKKTKHANAMQSQSERNASPSPFPSQSSVPIPIHDSNLETLVVPPHPPVATGRTTAEEMFQAYNDNRGVLPEVRSLTKDRVRKCNARTATTNGRFLSDFTAAIQRARVLPFCCGEGAHGWRVDFDFLIANDTNYLKILEGKYDHVRRDERPKSKADITRESCESILALSDPETGRGG